MVRVPVTIMDAVTNTVTGRVIETVMLAHTHMHNTVVHSDCY